MRAKIGAMAVLFELATHSFVADAVKPRGQCTIIDSGKLPALSGKDEAICAKVERAIAAKAPTARYTAEIKVVSASRLTTTLVVEGRALPLQHFAVMDRNLSEGSLERFASSLAAAVAKAAKD